MRCAEVMLSVAVTHHVHHLPFHAVGHPSSRKSPPPWQKILMSKNELGLQHPNARGVLPVIQQAVLTRYRANGLAAAAGHRPTHDD